MITRRLKRNLEGYTFVSLALVGILVFRLGPMLYSLWLAFCDYNILRQPEFIGLGNFKEAFSQEIFWRSVYITFYYVLGSLPLTLTAALGAAVLLNQKLRGMHFFRTLFYVPSVTAGVAVSILWMWVFEPQYGLLNQVLAMVGIKGPAWLGDPAWAMPALIFMTVWQMGTPMLIFLAGLQNIPTELYEVAILDGASAWRKFKSITLPLLSPSIFLNIVMGVINSFQVFEKVYIMTGGGPVNSTLVYVMYLYRNAFQFLRMGYGAALAWLLFVVIFSFTLLQFRYSSWVYYQGN